MRASASSMQLTAELYLHLDVSAPEEGTTERWLLGFGPDAHVIEPARLTAQIQRLHAQARLRRGAGRRHRSHCSREA